MTNWNEILKLYNLPEKGNDFGYQADKINEAETRLKISIPLALKSYYLALGKNENINTSHNRLLKPCKEIIFSDDGYLIFYEENQASVYWGIKQEDLKTNNPPVWGNYGTNTSPDWHLETKTTENFLLLMAIHNGTLGGLRYNANCFDLIKPEIVKKIQEKWKEIPEISWDRQEIYTNNFEEVFSLNFDNNKNCTAMFIGTSNQEHFDHLLESLDVDWSYISYEDE